MTLALVSNNQHLSTTEQVLSDICGVDVAISDQKINSGLALRLYRYALGRLDKKGFNAIVSNWSIEIYSVDTSVCLSERTYCVRWNNDHNGFIEVSGIQTGNGIPHSDYGLAIG